MENKDYDGKNQMPTIRPKTIEIFLPDGEPTSLKVAHIRNRTIEVPFIPWVRLVRFSLGGGRRSMTKQALHISHF